MERMQSEPSLDTPKAAGGTNGASPGPPGPQSRSDPGDRGKGKYSAILGISGSSVRNLPNTRLFELAIAEIAALEVEFSILDLHALDLPIYDPDMAERFLPQGVRVIRQMLSAHDGLLIVTPAINGSLPPLLKNALDWSSRPVFGSDALGPYRHKVAAIMATARDQAEGALCLAHLRAVLTIMTVIVLPDALPVPPKALDGGPGERSVIAATRHRVKDLAAALLPRGPAGRA